MTQTREPDFLLKTSPSPSTGSLHSEDEPLLVMDSSHSPIKSYSMSPLVFHENTSSLTLTKHIVSLFVVSFDARRGNQLEWCIGNVDLTGVEFKSLASGSHLVSRDYVFFRSSDYFGLSCFGKKIIDSASQRDVRLRSIGVLCTNYLSLLWHKSFLDKHIESELDNPGEYSSLVKYFKENQFSKDLSFTEPPTSGKASIQATSAPVVISNNLSSTSTPSSSSFSTEMCFNMNFSQPFIAFVDYFSVNIFVLWKFTLLKKRILFYSRPPVGLLSNRVHCCCQLASHSIPYVFERDNNPLFYINVADIHLLEKESKFIACTTERVFELKRHLYDIYLNGSEVVADARYCHLIKTNRSDHERFQELNHLCSSISSSGGDPITLEASLLRYFTELNSKLFKTLLDITSTGSGLVNRTAMIKMGLDPFYDKSFLQQLIDLYEFDATLDLSCCLY